MRSLRNIDSELSLYIHIPFCVRKCRYCDFYSVSIDKNDREPVNRYIDALIKEYRSYQNNGILDGRSVAAIYIGGGTPSILDIDAWERLDDAIFSRIDRSRIREWSVECNPESFVMDKAKAYAKSGVTRLTFGVQSMNDRELSICGRAHSAERAVEALGDARLGDMFRSTGVDIIYGLPGQTVGTLDDTLTRVLSISHVKHLSAYELTIAGNTPFGRHKNILNLPDDEIIAEMYELIDKRCAERGMAQYEVSNYALPGFESAHNKAYWSRAPYIGLGASAHSYIHPRRWSNVCDIDRYVSSLSSPSSDCSAVDFEETLTPSDAAREMIFLGLRNISGIDIDDISSRTGITISKECLRKYVGDGLLLKKISREGSSSRYIPTSRGMLFADMMARELA